MSREQEQEYLPHGVTVNEFLERLNPEELEKIQKDIVYSMMFISSRSGDVTVGVSSEAKQLNTWRGV